MPGAPLGIAGNEAAERPIDPGNERVRHKRAVLNRKPGRSEDVLHNIHRHGPLTEDRQLESRRETSPVSAPRMVR